MTDKQSKNIQNALKKFQGKTISEIDYYPKNEGTMIITFTDSSSMTLSASGDDMSYMTIAVQTIESKTLIPFQ
jgi:hypothetical protein